MSDARLSTMTVDLRSGDAISMAGVRVEFVHKSGQQARLRVTAPRDMPIDKNFLPRHESAADSRAKHGFIEPA
jgi:hypothetical protein